MSTTTSIGPDANRGGNDNPGNADGCGNKTLGTHATEQPPTAADGLQPPAPELPATGPGVATRPDPANSPRPR